MSHDLRRPVRLALLAALGFALPASAVVMEVPRVGADAGLGSAAPSAIAGAAVPGLGASFSAPALMAAPYAAASLPLSAPSLTAASLPAASAPAALPALAPIPALAAPALAPVQAAASVPVSAGPAAAPAASAHEAAAAPALDELRRLAASFGPGRGNSGSGAGRAERPAQAPVLVRNDEGVLIMGRAASFYREIRRMVGLLEPHMSLKESMDVMDGTIADVRTKLLSIEAIAKDRKISQANTHLEETLTWVDGILEDGDRRIAVHTVQVYFHPAPAGPLKAASEIEEGNRRIDAYLAQAAIHFAKGGDAEAALGKLDEVVLSFDTRGYKEIKDHIKQKEAEFKAKFGDHIRFAYVDELAPEAKSTEQVRADYNRLVEKYKGDAEGLQKILEGVMYSRYVGILLELKTLEYYNERGYKVLQSGRDMFGPDGKYITELDAVVKAPDGAAYLVEAKSARVGLPIDEVMKDKITYKLDVYKKNRALIEKMMGGPLKVVFSFDVGGRDARAAARGELVWQKPRQKELMEYLKAQEPVLSAKYGFPVTFLFLNSHPGENPMLFYQTPVEPQQQSGGGRKHGRNGRRN